MHAGVSNNQVISQKKLKGKPRIMGEMRSQRETEKHMATKGMSANRSAPIDGFRKDAPVVQTRLMRHNHGGNRKTAGGFSFIRPADASDNLRPIRSGILLTAAPLAHEMVVRPGG
jgi:hypothetical protein